MFRRTRSTKLGRCRQLLRGQHLVRQDVVFLSTLTKARSNSEQARGKPSSALEEFLTPRTRSGALLPQSVTRISDGVCEFYLVGTVHGTEESYEDVRKTIEAVEPDLVVVESSQSSKEYARNRQLPPDYAKVKAALSKGDLIQGFVEMYGRRLSSPAGGAYMREIRIAEQEAAKLGVVVMPADRPWNITLSRWLTRMPWWQRFQVMARLVMNIDTLESQSTTSKSYKDGHDAVRVSGGVMFPNHLPSQLSFVHERDLCFVSALRGSAEGWMPSEEGRSKLVVGVFGAAHTQGILRHWNDRFDELGLFDTHRPELWLQTDKLYSGPSSGTTCK
eukprot:Clim_evm24s66 gene=Clim_evmTU24s66